jgi:hypothetical protein
VTAQSSQAKRALSPRHRRSLLAGTLALALLIVGGGFAFTRRSVTPYDPSQAAEGITAELARGVPADHPHVTFRDAAQASGITFEHFGGERSTQLPEDMGSGAAWADFDNDGDDDLFIVNISGPLASAAERSQAERQRSNSPAISRLFRNDNGRFVDVTKQAGLVREMCGMGAAWGDADGDGWLDLVVTSFDRLYFFHNRRDGTFEDWTARTGLAGFSGFWTGASWGDYDRDGDVDLYICGYVQYRYDPSTAGQVSQQFAAEVPFTLNPSSYAPARNLLLRNDGRGRFVDVAAFAGVADPTGRSLSAAWCDLDDDGWLDLYVANDVSDNALFHNLGNGRFQNVAAGAWVADPRGAMGLAVGDWDLDGDFDIFVTHWLAQENALFSNIRVAVRGDPPGRMAFMDIADQIGLGQSSLDYIKWGTGFFDYDNDGRPDLISINGSTFEDPSNRKRLISMRHQLFWNKSDDDGFFDVAPISGSVLTEPTVGRGLALADYDDDGDVDALVVNHGSPARLLRNDGGNTRHWLKVRVRGRVNRFAYGALVSVTSGGLTQRQQIAAQSSYLSQHSLTQHFGLGGRDKADEVRVRFLDGSEVVLTAVAANQTIVIEEPTP